MQVPISPVRSRTLVIIVFEMLNTMIKPIISRITSTCLENSDTVLL